MNDIVPMPQGDMIPAGSAAEVSNFIRTALQSGTPASDLKTLFEIYERMTANDQRNQFARAMTKFMADCPPMPRGHASHLKRVNAAGVQVASRYSDMADIAKTIGPCLRANGLSYDWEETEIVDIGGENHYRAHIRIRHESGHSERKSGPPIPIGKPVQSAQMHASSVVTTAQRLCLRSAFGLYSIDQNEEDAAVEADKTETITEAQADELIALLAEYNGIKGDARTKALESAMLKAVGVESIAAIPAAEFEKVAFKLTGHVVTAKAGAK